MNPHELHTLTVASEQVEDAVADLQQPDGDLLAWPFPDLDALTGPLATGDVWFVCAASGGGKTTFIAAAIDRWQSDGKRVYVMPLEVRAKTFRTYLACLSLGLHPGDILSHKFRGFPEYRDMRSSLVATLFSQLAPPYCERVMVSAQRAITIDGLEAGLMEAKAFGADVVIVDHIDHIEGGQGVNLYAEAQLVNNAALRMAQDNDLRILFTSQLNMASSVGDYLAKYKPPKDEHVAFGSLKRRNATGMIGLFRPIRSRRPDETDDDYKAALTAARAGTTDIATALEPNTMGVVAMKLRNYGAREGSKVCLGVSRGHVHHLAERDQYQTHGGRVWHRP